MITENLSTLKIHKLTQSQYERERDADRLDENALYLTPDESIVIDETLSISGAAADAKVVGDAISNLNSGSNTTVDDALSNISTNPVQNKVVNAALLNKADADHTHSQYAAATDVSDLQTKVGDSSVSEQINLALDGFSSGKTLAEHLTEEDLVLVSGKHYGSTLPDPGTPGRIFFLKVSE